MKKEISPELYNYNRFPGPEFTFEAPQVTAGDLAFTLVFNSQETFDATAFSQRYSEILRQYDYIVGDWGNDQLRLKGFYKAKRHKANCIDHLEDYLKEYCNFGCQYFILENPAPKALPVVKESAERRSRRRKQTRRPNTKNQQQKPAEKAGKQANMRIKTRDDKAKSQTKKPNRERQAPANKQQHFTIRKKG